MKRIIKWKKIYKHYIAEQALLEVLGRFDTNWYRYKLVDTVLRRLELWVNATKVAYDL